MRSRKRATTKGSKHLNKIQERNSIQEAEEEETSIQGGPSPLLGSGSMAQNDPQKSASLKKLQGQISQASMPNQM